MSWKFWIKIQGSSEPTFQPLTTLSVELPIFGIHPTYSIESNMEVSMSGTEITQRRIRMALEIDCIPVSTWDTGTISTETIQYTLRTILQRKHTRLIAPDAGTNDKKLPDRWRDATNFPLTAGLISSGFVFARCDIQNEAKWESGLEKMTLTCYRKELL